MSALAKLFKDSPYWPIVKPVLKYAHPRHHRPYLKLGLARMRARLVPSAASAGRLSRAHLGIADLDAYQSDWSAVLASCEKAVAADPSSAEARRRRGEILLRLGRMSMWKVHGQRTSAEAMALLRSAAAYFEAAAEGPGETAEPWYELLSCYALLGRWKDFERALRRHLALRKADPELWRITEAEGELEYIPDSYLNIIGCTGLLTTQIKKKILLATRERIIFCAPPEKVVNPNFLSYYAEHIELVSDPHEIAAHQAKRAVCAMPVDCGMAFDGPPEFETAVVAKVAKRWAREKRPPLLKLRDSDLSRGREALKALGLPEDAWWVAAHVRTPSFHREGALSPEAFRNADISSYHAAFKAVARRGGFVFRMGDPKMPRLPAMDRVIDYAHSPLKSDWLDVFLSSQCRFFLGTQSGLGMVPAAFGTPQVVTNNAPILCTAYLPDDVVLPKLFKKDGRLLSFAEMVLEPYVGAVSQLLYDELGIETISNTEEELRAAVEGMLDQFDRNGARRVPPLTDLQARFDALAEGAGLSISGRIEPGFLERHRGLMPAAPKKDKICSP
ncbi:MAG: TIGR04372 family glycosyltransferase [Elusimicrobia bacterium]|nr:TIGR04372 family glycosyltransferase [Elusimicrobiota bacterium]